MLRSAPFETPVVGRIRQAPARPRDHALIEKLVRDLRSVSAALDYTVRTMDPERDRIGIKAMEERRNKINETIATLLAQLPDQGRRPPL